MPAERCDAIVIGATIEGLSCALGLALAEKKVVCADKKSGIESLGRDMPAWAPSDAVRTLGLHGFGVALGAPKPQVSIVEGRSRTLWPDLERTGRALARQEPADAERFVETIRFLQRQQQTLAAPGAAARAALARGALTIPASWSALELGEFLARDAAPFLSDRLDNPDLSGTLIAMAGLHAPAAPWSLASAPLLLAAARSFDSGADTTRPALGGERALIQALAAAFAAAGGRLALGAEVIEILTDREAASGVALSGGDSIVAPNVVVATAPRRLAQGLLSTRRAGRQLAALPSTRRNCLALARFAFTQAPLDILRGGTAFPDGVELWLGAGLQRITSQARAFTARAIAPEPVIVLTLEPSSRFAAVKMPYAPPELADGAWTAERRRDLLTAMIRTLEVEAPELRQELEDAELLTPRPPEQLGGTGAIFGGGSLPDLETLFGLRGEPPQQVLKGVYLCAASALEPDMASGLAVAQSILAAPAAKLRA